MKSAAAIPTTSVLESIPLALANNLVPDLLFTYDDRNIDSFDGVYDIARRNRLMVILDPVFSLEGPDMVLQRDAPESVGLCKARGSVPEQGPYFAA